jgi:hypothetical protein
VTTAAAIGIEAWPEAVSDLLDLLEASLTVVKEKKLAGSERGERSAGIDVNGANPRILYGRVVWSWRGWALTSRKARRRTERQEKKNDGKSDDLSFRFHAISF